MHVQLALSTIADEHYDLQVGLQIKIKSYISPKIKQMLYLLTL